MLGVRKDNKDRPLQHHQPILSSRGRSKGKTLLCHTRMIFDTFLTLLAPVLARKTGTRICEIVPRVSCGPFLKIAAESDHHRHHLHCSAPCPRSSRNHPNPLLLLLISIIIIIISIIVIIVITIHHRHPHHHHRRQHQKSSASSLPSSGTVELRAWLPGTTSSYAELNLKSSEHRIRLG